MRIGAGEPALTAANTVWVLISFEGPDPYSRVGGLGVRVTELGSTLAALGFETHHIFLGDPSLTPEERTLHGRLVLHRWGQWLDQVYGGGIYDGEATKVAELAASLPAYVVDRIIRPATDAGKAVIVLSEEWQTAACACEIGDACRQMGFDDRVARFWNANAVHGMDRIDWSRLARTNAITTVSHRMRGALRARGVDDTLVIPNGIAEPLTHVNGREPIMLRSAFNRSRLLVKVAPGDHEVGWTQALDAIALLRDRGQPATLIAHRREPDVEGGVARLREDVRARGLFGAELSDGGDTVARLSAIARRKPHVVILGFEVDASLERVLSAAADAVLANAVSEPFTSSELAAMAAGGVLFTGGAHGDYPVSAKNAVLLQTSAPQELVWRLDALSDAPSAMLRIRRAARATARRYTWAAVIARLLACAERPLRHVQAQHARRTLPVRRGRRRGRGSRIRVSPAAVTG